MIQWHFNAEKKILFFFAFPLNLIFLGGI
jgi:hypothetical protein